MGLEVLGREVGGDDGDWGDHTIEDVHLISIQCPCLLGFVGRTLVWRAGVFGVSRNANGGVRKIEGSIIRFESLLEKPIDH